MITPLLAVAVAGAVGAHSSSAVPGRGVPHDIRQGHLRLQASAAECLAELHAVRETLKHRKDMADMAEKIDEMIRGEELHLERLRRAFSASPTPRRKPVTAAELSRAAAELQQGVAQTGRMLSDAKKAVAVGKAMEAEARARQSKPPGK